MKIYTRTGDDGTTSLVGGTRVSKTDVRLDAYGTIDELNSHIGVITAHVTDKALLEDLRWIEGRLFAIGGGLATDMSVTPLYDSCRIFQEDVDHLENMIDKISAGLPVIKRFVLPGGTPASTAAGVARSVCRRAEREILRLKEQAQTDSLLTIFINRLSDYLFVLSRHLNMISGTSEVLW